MTIRFYTGEVFREKSAFLTILRSGKHILDLPNIKYMMVIFVARQLPNDVIEFLNEREIPHNLYSTYMGFHFIELMTDEDYVLMRLSW